MLGKAGRDLHCLECGAHWPMGDKAARALAAGGGHPSALHNNCSGKHAGFICLAVHEKHDPKGYIGADHPTMRRVSSALAEATGADLSRAPMGVDGCSIPTYALPLAHLATGFARFSSGEGFDSTRAEAARRIRKAVAARPDMVAGTDRFDTKLMSALGPRAFVKTGAEGVYCAALPDAGLGIALKVNDGATRASEAALAAVLARFLAPTEAERLVLEAAAEHVMRNWNGLEIGRVRASATLRDAVRSA